MKPLVLNKEAFPADKIITLISLSFLIVLFGYILIIKNVVIWIIVSVAIIILNYFWSRHKWIITENHIEVLYNYRKKKVIIPITEIKFSVPQGGRHSPVLTINIKYRKESKNSIFRPYYMKYMTPDKHNFLEIKKYALNHNIPLEGDWSWG